MNALTPVPSLIPDNAPFSEAQRSWLNGFFAAYLGVGEAAGEGGDAPGAAAEAEEDFPWHDAALPLADRLALANRAPIRAIAA